MWDGLANVMTLGGIMALASFLAGSLPLSLPLSPRQMRFLSSVGTGLLIGTALIVIIPEGVDTMYTAAAPSNSAVAAAEAERGGKAALALHKIHEEGDESAGRAEELAQITKRLVGSGARMLLGALRKRKEQRGADHETLQGASHAWVGVALVMGFAFMYLVDALQSPSHAQTHHPIPMTDLDSPSTPGTPRDGRTRSHATTIGLVTHAFADGIALGASSADTAVQSNLGLVVFVAILVHKAPAAFGLTSILLKQGFGKRAARGRLLLFSIAAPIGALATWTLVRIIGDSRDAASTAGSSAWWTGLVLVFSGGTFLYVAMHAMEEQRETDMEYGNVGPGKGEVVLMVMGMLTPLLTQLGHAGAHG